MLDRIQTISRLLDIAAMDFKRDNKFLPGEDITINIVRLIQSMTLPELDELPVDDLPNPPENLYKRRNYASEIEFKQNAYYDQFFHKILGCISILSVDDVSKGEKHGEKSKLLDSLIHWKRALNNIAEEFEHENFKQL